MAIPNKVVYAHHFDDLHEKTVADIAKRCHQAGATEFAPKLWQGTYLMGGKRDMSPLSPRTLDDVAALYKSFAALGITLTPYGVAFGDNPGAEGCFAAEVGKRCGNRVELDLEPYDDFWTVNRGGVADFARAVSGAGVALYVDADLRSSAMSQFPTDALKTIFGLAARVLGQCYYMTFTNHVATTFPTNATSYQGGTGWVDKLTDYLKGMGVPAPKRGMILDSPGWQQFGDAAVALNLRDSKTVGLWALSDASDTVLWAFEAIGGEYRVQTVEVVKEVEKEVIVYPDKAAVLAIAGRVSATADELRALPGMA